MSLEVTAQGPDLSVPACWVIRVIVLMRGSSSTNRHTNLRETDAQQQKADENCASGLSIDA
jgi:hypothetical protein